MGEDSEEMIEILKDIRRWAKIIGLEDAREKVQKAVSHQDDEKERENKIIYYLSDGSNNTRTIEKFVSVSHVTVTNRQQKWAQSGLMEKPGSNKPYRKLITLEEAGIKVPDIPDLEEGN